MESNKITAKFTAARATRLVSPNGAKSQNFEAGETKEVHKDLWSVAIASGLMPEEALEKSEPAPAPVEEPVAEKQSQEDLVSEGLLDACKTLIARGNPNDFTQMGQPRTAAVKKLVDFEFTANDVRRAFEQAMFEVENPEVD
jgi:hypothetical protein